MTSPDPNELRFLDVNNPLISGGPARIDTGIIDHPEAGKLGVFTLRTGSATVTALLSADDLDGWADHIKNLATALRGGPKLAAATMGDVAALETVQRRTR